MTKQMVQSTENLCAVLYIIVTAFEGIQFYNIICNNYPAPSEASGLPGVQTAEEQSN